jgi:hypothetical protein
LGFPASRRRQSPGRCGRSDFFAGSVFEFSRKYETSAKRQGRAVWRQRAQLRAISAIARSPPLGTLLAGSASNPDVKGKALG